METIKIDVNLRLDDKHGNDDDDDNEDAATRVDDGFEGFGTIDGRFTHDLKEGNRGNNGTDELLLLWSSTVATGAPATASTTTAAEDNGRSR